MTTGATTHPTPSGAPARAGAVGHALPASIVALAGGVGGSRLARGLRGAAPQARLTVVVNTGDDVTLHGLRISPDVDTVLYAMSGLVDEGRGWGPRGDTFRCMEALERLGGETWFRLGDLDLATHLRRTERLAQGLSPTAVTAELARAMGLSGVTVLPMTDHPVETWVQLQDGARWVHFQEYFVKERAAVPIRAVQVRGIESARPAPGLLEAIGTAEAIVLCPSNPFVSLGPILQVAGVRQAIRDARRRGTPVAGVSPLIGGATVKGPAARMMVELGHQPTAAGVAALFADLLDLFLIDPVDAHLAGAIEALGVRPLVAPALMRGRRGEVRLARALLGAVPGVRSLRGGDRGHRAARVHEEPAR
ncbi:MAG TPA: 2-phospho-L-lactate transferase [Chloroflexota bacterium]|nr:2-phospho-L-lactate transferase [Chloroflexota bacterium]